MVAGGAECAISRIGIAGFAAARALSTGYNDTPEKASRPWDQGRDGFVMGEGAGVVVLEEYEHAKARNAKIYAELAGFGASADGYHMTAPHQPGMIDSMKIALNDANINANDIDYINAHGTSTPLLDPMELEAVKIIMGDHINNMCMSSTKSMTGHLLGAAGAIEALFSVLAIRDQIVPPTINLDNPDEGCTGVNLVPHEAQQRKITTVLSNSFGFGGTNGTLIFKALN
jgi:3-oxoacyl-[acyl-carrier-protein] synthase II